MKIHHIMFLILAYIAVIYIPLTYYKYQESRSFEDLQDFYNNLDPHHLRPMIFRCRFYGKVIFDYKTHKVILDYRNPHG